MNKYVVTYHDEIKANTLEEAQKRLLVVLKSDIEISKLFSDSILFEVASAKRAFA